MTKPLRVLGTLTAASTDARTLTYTLLPYGQPGRTNLGTVTASAGVLELPAPDELVGNLEHNPTAPVSRAVVLEDTPDALLCTVRVLGTRAGDDLLVEADERVRAGISVEIGDPVIRGGALIAGRLTGYGHVTVPAFPGAQLAAADYGDDPDDDDDEQLEDDDDQATGVDDAEQLEDPPAEQDDPPAAPAAPQQQDTPTDPDGDDDEEEEDENMGATARAQAGGLTARAAAPTPTITRGELFTLLATAHKTGGERAMLAALADVVPANTVGTTLPQYVGELWSGRKYERRFVPLFAHADLTSFEVKGWRWTVKPTVAPYAGNRTAVPSNTPQTEQVTVNAERIAGAHGIDRKHRDFNDEAFFAAYFSAMVESYAQVSDLTALADAVAAAGAPIAVGTVPAGVNPAMAGIVDGAIAVLEETNAMPSFAVVASGLWRSMVLTREQDRLAYLNAALGFDEGTLTPSTFKLLPSSQVAAGTVLVGARDAMTVHELGGDAPIRVEAEAISVGGVDEGVFGYLATNVHDADGLVVVDVDGP